MSRPLIGVTTSEVRLESRAEPLPEGDPPQREMALGMVYMRAVEKAGGIPVVLPPLGHDAIGPLLDRLCGVCLSGGPDIDPHGYGEGAHPQLGPTEPDLDAFELAIAQLADARGMPMVGICRGAQASTSPAAGRCTSMSPTSPRAPSSTARPRARRCRRTRCASTRAHAWRP